VHLKFKADSSDVYVSLLIGGVEVFVDNTTNEIYEIYDATAQSGNKPLQVRIKNENAGTKTLNRLKLWVVE